MNRKILYPGLTLALIVPALITAQQQEQEHVDLNVIHRLKTAEFGGGGEAAAVVVTQPARK